MIKLYLDEDVHKKIAMALRVKGYDVIRNFLGQAFEFSSRKSIFCMENAGK